MSSDADVDRIRLPRRGDEDPAVSAELKRRIAMHFRAIVPHMSDDDFEKLVADMAAFRYRWEGPAALDRFPTRGEE